jgi:hypothetical protein
MAWDFLKELNEKETEHTKHATAINIADLESAVVAIEAEVPTSGVAAFEAMVDFANAHFASVCSLGRAYGGALGIAEGQPDHGGDNEAVAVAKRVRDTTLHAIDKVLVDARHFIAFHSGMVLADGRLVQSESQDSEDVAQATLINQSHLFRCSRNRFEVTTHITMIYNKKTAWDPYYIHRGPPLMWL